ncbi:cupin superfamily protein [Emydomyces testavorans]|uniref:Cupin superfamily protein n=1 Tax=Emydomyces testavorans TaxID=2070801 RepID=A0AAF0IG48_9EURO|nr:cupin superfamily protein [Emydomyces testavorans]
MKYASALLTTFTALASAGVLPGGKFEKGLAIGGDGRGGPFSGATNHELDLQNPNALGASTDTDSGNVPNMKWSFSLSKMRLFQGGWVREQAITDLPSSHDIAAAQVHMSKGTIRQMHWHRVAEWGFVYAGRILLSAVDYDGKFQLDHLEEGDMYYFPKGLAHSLQGLEDENEVLLCFDDGDFDRVGTTFMINDWITHTPKSVLAKNFNVSEHAFDKSYNPDRALVNSTISKKNVTSPNGELKGNSSYVWHYKDHPAVEAPGRGGMMQVVDSRNFPVAKTMAANTVRLKPGGLRELHWHPCAEEWIYFHKGTARATVYIGSGNSRTFDFQAGDTGVFPENSGHYVENLSQTDDLIYFEIFKADRVTDVSLAQWLSMTPSDIAAAAINVPIEVVEQMKKEKQLIVQGNNKPSNQTRPN